MRNILILIIFLVNASFLISKNTVYPNQYSSYSTKSNSKEERIKNLTDQLGLHVGLSNKQYSIGLHIKHITIVVNQQYSVDRINYKSYLDMDFVNAWNDHPYCTIKEYRTYNAIYLFDTKMFIVPYAGVGLTMIQNYEEIHEGNVSIFPNGIYTIDGDTESSINLICGSNFQVSDRIYFFAMYQTSPSQVFAGIGLSIDPISFRR